MQFPDLDELRAEIHPDPQWGIKKNLYSSTNL